MLRPGNNCCGNEAGLVQKFIGSAYDVVKNVHDNLEEIKFIFDFMAKYDVLLCVESLEELKAVNEKSSKFVRWYVEGNGANTYTDYIYVSDDKSGVLPDNPLATGSWVKVNTLLGAGGGNSIPWLYNHGSANGGEVNIHVEEDAIGVSEIFINGLRKHLGIGYTYEPVSRTIQLPTPLVKGDQLVAKLIGYPALPNTPNISEFMFVNWVYNNGTAIGGETKLKPPYTFQKVPAVFINGLRKLENHDYVVGYSDYSINLTLPLKTNDVVIVQLGGEPDAFSIDTYIAREALRRTYAEAGMALVDGSFEDGAKVTTKQDVVLERKTGKGYNWQGDIPSGGKVIPAGSTPISAGGVGPNKWQDLSAITYANQREFTNGRQYILYRAYEAAVTLTQVNEAVQFSAEGIFYRWDGVFPQGGLIIPHNTPEPASDQTGPGKYVAILDLSVKDQVFSKLISSSGAKAIGVMPHGTVQDAIYWVTPEVFQGAADSDKITAAIEYAVANNCIVVAHGNYTITKEVPVSGSVVIDVSAGEFTFSGTDKIFRPIGGGSFVLKGSGKFIAAAYVSNRPCVVYSDYSDGYRNLPTEVEVSGIRCFNSGIGQIAVNAEDSTSVKVSVSDNYVMSDSNTDAYVSSAGITDASSVTPYLSVLGVTATSVDILTPRKPRVSIEGNTFDVYMQSGPNADMIKVGAATLGSSLIGNGFINRNPDSACELDTFTGGLRSIVDNNDFVNCGVKLMTLQISGGPRIGLGGKSSVSGNTFTFDSNPLNDFAIFLRTSLVAISGNVFYYKGAMGSDVANQRIFNFITAQALDNNNNGFGGTLCAGITISSNTMQMDLDPNVNRALRMQCVNTTDMAGSTISGNAMFGGFGMVLDARPERNRNIWTGNYISSGFFTAEDVWRMNSAFVGGGNYIGSGYDNTVAGIPMIPKTIPQLSNGSKIRITLDHQIRTSAASDRCLYLLHVRVSGGVKNNYATYIMSSGVHDATDRADATDLRMPVDQRLNPGNTAASNLQSCFKAGYNSAGYIVLEAMSTYSSSDQPPTKIEYAIVPLSSPFPTSAS